MTFFFNFTFFFYSWWSKNHIKVKKIRFGRGQKIDYTHVIWWIMLSTLTFANPYAPLVYSRSQGQGPHLWRRKTGFGFFCWMKMNRFNMNFNMERSNTWDDSEKRPKIAKKIFCKILGRFRKSIQFGKLDQKSLFFILFFIG